MKTIKIAVVFVMAMILAGSAMAQASGDTKETMVVPLSEPGKPFKLNVGLISGSIKVMGYEGKDVVIEVSAPEEKRKGKDASNGMKRITAGNGLDLTAEEKNNSVRIHTNSMGRSIRLVIKVPMSEATLKLSTVNDGDIVISNVNGEIEASNVNGDVTATGVSGSVVANSTNGDLIVNFKTVDAKAAMGFSTFNGKIDVTFPATLKANVKLKSDQGEIYSDFEVDADKSPAAAKTSNGGTFRIKIDNTVLGKIGGGGPELMMKTWNGNVYIRKAKA